MTIINKFVRYFRSSISIDYKYVLSNRLISVCNLIPIAGIRYYAKSAEDILGLDKPKRPFTPFLRFATQLRPDLKAKHPEAGAIDIMKLAGQQWKEIHPDVKAKLTKEYEEDLKEYRRQKEEYSNSLTEQQKIDLRVLKMELAEAKEKKKTKAENKALGKPKRPVTAYMLFSHSQKGRVKEIGFQNYIAETKQKWYKLTHAERTDWDKRSQQLWDDYRNAMKAWEEKMIQDGHEHLVRTSQH